MGPKRPGIKQSSVTKLLRKGPLAQTDRTGEEQDALHESQHGWHQSFDAQSCLSSWTSLAHQDTCESLSSCSIKQLEPQVSPAALLQWLGQFQDSDVAFCSGTQLLQHTEDIFGPGASIRMLAPALSGSGYGKMRQCPSHDTADEMAG